MSGGINFQFSSCAFLILQSLKTIRIKAHRGEALQPVDSSSCSLKKI